MKNADKRALKAWYRRFSTSLTSVSQLENLIRQQSLRTEACHPLPGQAVSIQKGGNVRFCQVTEQKSYTPDIFEYFHFDRPDTYTDGISVHRSREHMGRKLAMKMKRTMTEQAIREINVFILVPGVYSEAIQLPTER